MTKYQVSPAVMTELEAVRELFAVQHDGNATLEMLIAQIAEDVSPAVYEWVYEDPAYHDWHINRERERAIDAYVFDDADNFEVLEKHYVIRKSVGRGQLYHLFDPEVEGITSELRDFPIEYAYSEGFEEKDAQLLAGFVGGHLQEVKQ